MDNKMPVFVKVEEYDEILDLIKQIKEKINESKSILSSINDLKSQEDQQLESWGTTLNEVEKKIDFINHSLNEPEKY